MSDLVGNPDDRFSRVAAQMSHVIRKPLFGVYDKAYYKPAISVESCLFIIIEVIASLMLHRQITGFSCRGSNYFVWFVCLFVCVDA